MAATVGGTRTPAMADTTAPTAAGFITPARRRTTGTPGIHTRGRPLCGARTEEEPPTTRALPPTTPVTTAVLPAAEFITAPAPAGTWSAASRSRQCIDPANRSGTDCVLAG